MRKQQIKVITLISLATTFLGELKMIPFGGDSFRFSLGTAAYFFGIIWFSTVSPVITGLFVGCFVVLFRTTLDWAFHPAGIWTQGLIHHLPSALFYIIFAIVLEIGNINRRMDSPLQGGILGAVGEFLGNCGELLFRFALGDVYLFYWQTIPVLLLFAVLRSFFVIGVYNILMVRQIRAVGEEQNKRIEGLLLINANLYEEGVWLQKSMVHIEEITRDSYELYRRLTHHVKQGFSDKDAANLALSLAQEVHEVKKDCQRILAGLSKIIRQESLSTRTPIQKIVALVIRSNQQYAEMLGKIIQLSAKADLDLVTNRVYGLLSILNNLVANAVEAIEKQGEVGVECRLTGDQIEFLVWDTGPGIQEEDQMLIFQPGFTTKYDKQGNPSTGIGLSHVCHLVETFQGRMETEFQCGKTIFHVFIPSANLLEEEHGYETAILHH